MSSPRKPSVFIGSSSEAELLAMSFYVSAQKFSDATLWSDGVFAPGEYTLESLIKVAKSVDFAVLVATGDDATESRGENRASPRDNVIFEFGLFLGILGRERTYLLAEPNVKLPTDLLGLTRLPYDGQNADGSPGDVIAAQLQLRLAMKKHGLRVNEPKAAVAPQLEVPTAAVPPEVMLPSLSDAAVTGPQASDLDFRAAAAKSLQTELDKLILNAEAQGWTVANHTETALRLITPKKETLSFQKKDPVTTREELRKFAALVKQRGVRVNSALLGPVADSPF